MQIVKTTRFLLELEKMNKAINIWFDPKKEPFEVLLELESDAIVYFERKPIPRQYLIGCVSQRTNIMSYK